MTLETITGNLRAVEQLVKGTLQHWDELSRDQTADPSLGNQAYWVADYPQYSKQGDKAMLHLARLDHNLVIRHLFDEKKSSWDPLLYQRSGNFFRQLLYKRTGHFFRPSRDEAQEVIAAASTLAVPLRALRLQQGAEKGYRSLQVRTKDGFINTSANPEEPRWGHPIPEEQHLLDRAGYTPAFLQTLQNSRWSSLYSRIYVLNPDAVLQVAAKGPVGRAAWRHGFDNLACSTASGYGVNNLCALRGVRRVAVPETSQEEVTNEVT